MKTTRYTATLDAHPHELFELYCTAVKNMLHECPFKDAFSYTATHSATMQTLDVFIMWSSTATVSDYDTFAVESMFRLCAVKSQLKDLRIENSWW